MCGELTLTSIQPNKRKAEITMSNTHTTLTTKNALAISAVLMATAALFFAFAPMNRVAAARGALATRINASATANKILSVAPVPVRNVIKRRLAQPELKAAPFAASTAMGVAGIALESTPSSGSAVGQQSPLNVIAYTMTVTNDGTGELEGTGGVGTLTMTFNAASGTLLQNQPIV